MNGNLNSLQYYLCTNYIFSCHTISNSYRQIWESNSIVECINYLEHASHAIFVVCCFGLNFADAKRCRDVEIYGRPHTLMLLDWRLFHLPPINYCWTCTHTRMNLIIEKKNVTTDWLWEWIIVLIVDCLLQNVNRIKTGWNRIIRAYL